MGPHYEVSIEVDGRRYDIAQIPDELDAQNMVTQIAKCFKPQVRACDCGEILF
jgi:hypothetical protein